MQVLLENIAFNHDPDLSKTGSFFLRRNETQIVRRPEWSNESCRHSECAPAGYVISMLPDMLTIKASFVCDDPSDTTTIHIQALESGNNILSAVKAMPVTFTNGRSGPVTFDLPNARSRIIAAGIRVRDITWDWQFSKDGEHWTNFQTTEHRIYTVREMPNLPWKPESNNVTEINVPWTEVLDYACKWAEGLNDKDQAAESITRNVFHLGQENLIRWEDGYASYARDQFDCTAFLKLLKRRIGKRIINCDDCATIVSTFANVLGCNLFQSDMGFVFFTNPVVLIGHTEESIQRFSRHAVAWKLNCDEHAALFDACLQVDADGMPKAKDPKHEFIHPTNLVFSTARQNSYRSCLFDVGTCNPDPNSKQQRSLGSGLLTPGITNVALLDFLKRHYQFDTWPAKPESSNKASTAFSFLQSFRDAFDGWQTRKLVEFEDKRFSAIEALLKRSEPSQSLIEITVYELKPVETPNELLLQLLGQSEALHFERLAEPAIGEVAFVLAPQHNTVLFRRGSFVTLIRSVGIQQTNVVAQASQIDSWLRDQ